MADMDVNMLFHWIYENTPYRLTDPHDLANAMNSLSMADVYRGRIQSTRNWSLLRYVIDLMTAGVAMARDRSKPSGWVPYKFPEYLRWLSRTKSERKMKSEISKKIRKRCHISSARAEREFIPYLRIILNNNREMATGIAKWLEMDKVMVDHLSEV